MILKVLFFLRRFGIFRFPTVRNRKMIEKLHDEGGIDISWEAVRRAFARQYQPGPFCPLPSGSSLHQDHAGSFHTLCRRYLSLLCPAGKGHSVTGSPPDPENQKPGLAHPLQYHLSDEELRHLVRTLKRTGSLVSKPYPPIRRWMKAVWRCRRILISSSCNFHGSNKPAISWHRKRKPEDFL